MINFDTTYKEVELNRPRKGGDNFVKFMVFLIIKI